MNTAQAVFNFLADAFATLIAHTQFGAVVIATFSAIGVTQLVKMIVINTPSIPNGPWRVWYVTTSMTGLIITVMLWPTLLGFAWGIAAGTLFAPVVYLIGTRLAYKYFPDLESKISATPRNDK
jgi:hypothetical protein